MSAGYWECSYHRGAAFTGPKAKPSTKIAVLSTITSVETLNSSAASCVPGLNTDEANVTQNVTKPSAKVLAHFLLRGQFIGFPCIVVSKRLALSSGTHSYRVIRTVPADDIRITPRHSRRTGRTRRWCLNLLLYIRNLIRANRRLLARLIRIWKRR